jgi:hypothetical protein
MPEEEVAKPVTQGNKDLLVVSGERLVLHYSDFSKSNFILQKTSP